MKKPSPALGLTLLAGLWVSGPAPAQLPVEVHRNPAELLTSPDTVIASNKRLVFDFWREVLQAHDAGKAANYVAPDYIEHDPTLESRLAALVERIGRMPPRPTQPAIEDLVAIVAEGDRVVVATRRELPDLEEEGQTYTTTWFDLFRVRDGKIVEHWNYGPRD
jgi:predicted SnoaL-like aldol condensation-catalyzing enzyme